MKSKKSGPSKTAKEKSAKMPSDLHKQVFLRTVPGAMGIHAIVEGNGGLWAASKESASDAVLKAVSRHILIPALREAEALKKLLRIDIREVGEGLWLVETGVLDNPGLGQGRIHLEPRGQMVSEELIDPEKADPSFARKALNGVRKMAAMIL